jgi:hypothetical protein
MGARTGEGSRDVSGAGCRVQGAGCRVQSAGCRVQGAGSRVLGLGRDVSDVEFLVQGLQGYLAHKKMGARTGVGDGYCPPSLGLP